MAYSCNRRYLLRAAGILAPIVLSPRLAAARSTPRQLSFYHTHTGEKLDVVYAENGSYISEALGEINFLLRDFRTNDIHPIDPKLLDILWGLQERAGRVGPSRGQYEVISGFRSPVTNQMLRHQSGGVAQNSLHLKGQAIDVRLSGADTRALRGAALAMARGGVGYYADSDFVHLDTGRVRSW